MLHDLVLRTRTIRRFQEDTPVTLDALRSLVDLARLAPCAGNKQPFKYVLSASRKVNERVFPHLRWAAYLPAWPGPPPGERPAAYIVICRDTRISDALNSDQGFAAQNILLGAAERELGACVIASFVREKVREVLHIPATLDPIWVIALGAPREIVAIEPINGEGDVKYWRDDAQVHHVPKRSLDEIVIGQFASE